MRRIPSGSDFDGWVALLGSTRHRQGARLHLIAHGRRAVPAIRRGLHHDDATVRRLCVNLLDRLVDDDAVPDLVDALDDTDPAVVGRALHALACDACKEGTCRPADDLFVPRAVELLSDANPDVRAAAVDALGKVAERGGDVIQVLEMALATEPDPGLREMVRHRIERLR
jgi:HEAT repeat protein